MRRTINPMLLLRSAPLATDAFFLMSVRRYGSSPSEATRVLSNLELEAMLVEMRACLDQPNAMSLRKHVARFLARSGGTKFPESFHGRLSHEGAVVVRRMLANCELLAARGLVVRDEKDRTNDDELTAVAWMQAALDLCGVVARQQGRDVSSWARAAYSALVTVEKTLRDAREAARFFAALGSSRMVEALYGPPLGLVDDEMATLVKYAIEVLNAERTFHACAFRQVTGIFLLDSRWQLLAKRHRFSPAESPPVSDERIREALRGVIAFFWHDPIMRKEHGITGRFVKRPKQPDDEIFASSKPPLTIEVERYLAKGYYRSSPFAIMSPHRFSVVLRHISKTRIYRSNLEPECILMLVVIMHYIGRTGSKYLPLSGEDNSAFYTSVNMTRSLRRIADSTVGHDLLTMDPDATKGALAAIDQLGHLIYEPLHLKVASLSASSEGVLNFENILQWIDTDESSGSTLSDSAAYVARRTLVIDDGRGLLLLLDVLRHLSVVTRLPHPLGAAALMKLQLLGIEVLHLPWETLSVCTEMSRMHQFVGTIGALMKRRVPMLATVATAHIPRLTMAASGNGPLRRLLEESGSEPLLAALLAIGMFLRFVFPTSSRPIVRPSPKCSMRDFARYVEVCLAPSIERALADVSPNMTATEAHERVRAIYEVKNVGYWASLRIVRLLRFARRELGQSEATTCSRILQQLPLDFDEPCADEIRRLRDLSARKRNAAALEPGHDDDDHVDWVEPHDDQTEPAHDVEYD